MLAALLSEYKGILVAYERDYRQLKGTECQALVQAIMEEMSAQSEGGLSANTMKGLDKVS